MSWRDIIKAFPDVIHDKNGEAFHFVGRQGNLGKYSNGEKEILFDEKKAKLNAPSKGLTMADDVKFQIEDNTKGTSFQEFKEAMASAVMYNGGKGDHSALFNSTSGQRKKKKEDEE